jgi:carbon-monoxide dehydrogenase iron sulfur subunit
MAKTITVDESRCLACKACVVECALAHTSVGTLAKAIESGATLQPRVHVEAVGEFGMPMQCRHCSDAPCVAVCPTEAVKRYRDDGPVLLDQDRCIGCGLCLLVCPFGVIDMSRTGKGMVKCDLCIERTAMGEEPACVAGCPTHALKYQDIEQWLAQRRKQAAEMIAVGAANASDDAESEDGPGQG